MFKLENCAKICLDFNGILNNHAMMFRVFILNLLIVRKRNDDGKGVGGQNVINV